MLSSKMADFRLCPDILRSKKWRCKGSIGLISFRLGSQARRSFFQKQMGAILGGLPGVLCHLDDILVFGKDSQEHDAHLQAVLEQIRAAGITLNSQKCEFSKLLGNVINKHGISPQDHSYQSNATT